LAGILDKKQIRIELEKVKGLYKYS